MLKRTLVIETAGHLTLKQGQLNIVYSDVDKAGNTVPIEDLGILILENSHCTVSNALLANLAENNVVVVHCGGNKMPIAFTMPVQANTLFSQRLQQQTTVTLALQKNLWQQTIKAKIKNQRLHLQHWQIPCLKMKQWEEAVFSGDSQNHESRAAAFYWSQITGIPGFVRDPEGFAPNALLNYGYAILRAITARSLVGSGLHPSLGIFHRNKYNAYCLADDIMEPYRPAVDWLVRSMLEQGTDCDFLGKEQKQHLLQLPVMNVKIEGKVSPLLVAMSRTTASLADCYAGKRKLVRFPEMMFK